MVIIINKMKKKYLLIIQEPLYLECKAFIDWLKLDILPPSPCKEAYQFKV